MSDPRAAVLARLHADLALSHRGLLVACPDALHSLRALVRSQAVLQLDGEAGRVYTLGPAALPAGQLPLGATTAMSVALLQDTLAALRADGYTVMRIHCRPGTRIPSSARVRVPDDEMFRLEGCFPSEPDYRPQDDNDTLGHPLVVTAGVAGGELTTRVRTLADQHAERIRRWHSPLIVGVGQHDPDLTSWKLRCDPEVVVGRPRYHPRIHLVIVQAG